MENRYHRGVGGDARLHLAIDHLARDVFKGPVRFLRWAVQRQIGKLGPARIAAVRDLVLNADAQCVLSEPLARGGLVQTVAAGTDVRVVTVDPAGTGMTQGPQLYLELLRALSSALKECMP